MGKFDWCAVVEKQWCNLWKRQNVLSLGPPSKMRMGQVRRTGSMGVLDENEKKIVIGVMQKRSTGMRNEWASTVTFEDGRGRRLSQQGLGI